MATAPSSQEIAEPLNDRATAHQVRKMGDVAAISNGNDRIPSCEWETVVLDEVQRVPELLNVVHDLLSRPQPRRFVLTGSSARKLRRGGIDLLAGRAVLRNLHPFMAAELPGFQLSEALTQGLPH